MGKDFLTDGTLGHYVWYNDSSGAVSLCLVSVETYVGCESSAAIGALKRLFSSMGKQMFAELTWSYGSLVTDRTLLSAVLCVLL